MDSAEEELAGADRGVRLLAKRVVQLLNGLVVKPMTGMPGTSKDWAETMAARRLLTEKQVTWERGTFFDHTWTVLASARGGA